MLLLKFLLTYFGVVVVVSSSADDEPLVFRKCCAKEQSLVKTQDSYLCVDKGTAETNYSISEFSSLILKDTIRLQVGMPDECDKLQMVPIIDHDSKKPLKVDSCYDRLVATIINGSSIENIPKTVAITCPSKELAGNKTYSTLRINNLQKCCPPGQSYDREYHSCRNIPSDKSDDWKTRVFSIDNNYVYESGHKMHCKDYEYLVELSEDVFKLQIEGNHLHYLGKNGEGVVPKGEWCIDGEFNTRDGLVAQVCTQNCAQFRAFCVRKCCPMGYHYKPIQCGSFRSRCVANDGDDELLFDLSSYLDPLKEDDSDEIFDVMGVRTSLSCTTGKFALNRSSPIDEHWMTRQGLLYGSESVDPHNYCLELFDMRECPGPGIEVTGLTCFSAGTDHDFSRMAVINILSAVCLALTVIVYCALPELRNLHGRTIICHATTMCFGYSCLAAAQNSYIANKSLCKFVGYGIYFGFVAAFVWLNVMCFDIWWTFGSIRSVQPLRKASAERRRFIWYSLYAWGLSLLFTGVVLLLDRYPVSSILDANIGLGICWFGSIQNSSSDWPHYIFFVIPLGLMTFVNLVLWLLTARHCARVKSEVHRMQAGSTGDRAKKRFRIDRANYVLTGKLWVVMGAGWFSELVSTLTHEPPWLFFCVDLINQLQGVMIFVLFVFKPKIYHLIRKRIGCSRTPKESRLEKPDVQKNGASSGRTSSTFLSRTISSDEKTNLRTSLPNNAIKKA